MIPAVALPLLLDSCDHLTGFSFGVSSYGDGYVSAGWSSAWYDNEGFPIYGYDGGRPVYGYTPGGLAIYSPGALTYGCYVPSWAPASWYVGIYRYPSYVRRYYAPPRCPAAHRPGYRPPRPTTRPAPRPEYRPGMRPGNPGRPNHGVGRPNFPGRPGHGAVHPDHGATRPNMPNRPDHGASRPGMSKPSSAASRPSVQSRPQSASSAGAAPSWGVAPKAAHHDGGPGRERGGRR